MASENLMTQMEEIEALASIYGDDFKCEIAGLQSYTINIVENGIEAILNVTLPPEYPSHTPPKLELSAPTMGRKDKLNLHLALDQLSLDHAGETVVYQCVETVREKLLSIKKKPNQKKTKQAKKEANLTQETEVVIPEITHGQVIVDRKSSFQAHAAVVTCMEDVHAVLRILKEKKKIAHATHNMYAYRIERGATILQDCDDDGEAHAGGRMLHLLQILNQKNTLVVVSRWYGGIQLGPDRFRHINNATRQVLVEAGILKK